jgi:CMP-N-acetylneuraminic acid synthetase
MNKWTTAVFLPCRSGSERVPHKNTKPFGDAKDGLLGIKLDHLERLPGVDAIVLDSNDPVVLRYGQERQRRWRGAGSELVVVRRPDHLGQSSTTTDSLIQYGLETVDCETMVWTHVTSPFFDEREYARALNAYRERDTGAFDSLMAVTRIQSFCWVNGAPVNYQRAPIRWPRTQDLTPILEVNSGMFIVDRLLGLEMKDRIGRQPILFEVPPRIGLDIDDLEGFHLAEQLFRLASAPTSA